MEAQGVKAVVRFKVPQEGQTKFDDLLRGEVVFENRLLDDFVLLKSDGFPVYHLANVVDDYLMEITHVLRAEEWLSSTPRHILLYDALGYQPPVFAHMPLILGPDRSKLSKRHGAATLTEYREQGYLPETMLNFLALLGWSLDEKTELFTRQQLIDNFSLERVSRTAGIFNKEKLDWMNGMYLRGLSLDDYIRRALPFLDRDLPPDVARPVDEDYIRRWVPLIKERAKTLGEITQLGLFFYQDPQYEPGTLLIKGHHQLTRDAYQQIQKLVESMADDREELENQCRALAANLNLKPGELFNSMRTAVTGRSVSPPLFDTMIALGKCRVQDRIRDALVRLIRMPE